MRADGVEPQFHQGRSKNGRQKDIAGGDRHPHAQHKTGKRAEDQQQKHALAAILHELTGKRAAHAGNRQRSDHQTDAAEGCDQIADVAGDILQQFQRVAEIWQATVTQQPRNQHQGGCIVGGARRAEHKEHRHQRRQRQDVMPAACDHLQQSGLHAVGVLRVDQPVARGIKINLQHQRHIIKHRRHDCRDHDRGVRRVEKGRHNKGHSPHHRGHQCASRRGAGLYCGGIFGRVSGPLHRRDRQPPGGQNIGDHRPRQ